MNRVLRSTFAFTLAVFLSGAANAGETLDFAWPSNVGPLNPHQYSPNQMFAQGMVYEPLVRYLPDGSVGPWLATSWEISPDGRVYTFKLREGVIFSDGTPFDATAVKMNFGAVMKNRERHNWLELVNQMESVKAIDPLTVQLTLKGPYYPALQDLALVRPVRFLSPSGFPADGDTAEKIGAPIGTGPWMRVETRLGEYDLFARNSSYWGEAPAFDQVKVKVIPDPNSRAVALETGDVDLVYGADGPISADAFARFQGTGRFEAAISEPLATRVIALNSNRAPTNELAVRQAINHAVDKDALIAGVLYGLERRADTLFSVNLPYADVGLTPYAFDAAKAEALLEAAGWTRPGPGATRMKGGAPLALELAFVGNDATHKAIAEVIQANLAAIGFEVSLIGEEPSAFYARQNDGRFGMIFGDTWGTPYDPHSFASSMRVPSHADYQAQLGLPMKADIDATIGAVLISTEESERAALWRSLLTTLHEQAVYLPLSYKTMIAVARPEVTGLSFGATEYEIPFEKLRPAGN